MFWAGSTTTNANEFKTLWELIARSENARTYLDPPDPVISKADIVSRLRSAETNFVRIRRSGSMSARLFMLDAYKGVINGVTDQSKWSINDFRLVPGGLQIEANLEWVTRGSKALVDRVFYSQGGPAGMVIEISTF